MKVYKIYFPSVQNDGTPIDPSAIEGFKTTLMKVFGATRIGSSKVKVHGKWAV